MMMGSTPQSLAWWLNADATSLIGDLPLVGKGWDSKSVCSMVTEDIRNIVGPTADIVSALTREFGTGVAFDSDRFLEAVIQQRILLLSEFLNDAANIVMSQFGNRKDCSSPPFSALAGDSHNGGRRPLAIQLGAERVVLKFADPRPYSLLTEVLQQLSHGLGIDLIPPPIVADPNNQWYFIPFSEDIPEKNGDVNSFMFAIGALSAVARLLRITDLHAENIVVHEGKPVIIDPECILYNFDPDDGMDYLLKTGLLSQDVHLSGLRGGSTDKIPIWSFELHHNDDGRTTYRKPIDGFRNRFRYSNGPFADPADYRQNVLAGYNHANDWFKSNVDLLSDVISANVAKDFRIRFLIRFTRHYVSVLHMLNLPKVENYQAWVGTVLDRFKRSGSFLEVVPSPVETAEISDIQNRDIPYFWIHAGEKNIYHRSGLGYPYPMQRCPRDQALVDIRKLKDEDSIQQMNAWAHFFDLS